MQSQIRHFHLFICPQKLIKILSQLVTTDPTFSLFKFHSTNWTPPKNLIPLQKLFNLLSEIADICLYGLGKAPSNKLASTIMMAFPGHSKMFYHLLYYLYHTVIDWVLVNIFTCPR